MSELSKQALKVENNTSFPNNNSGEISAADLRAFNVDMIDSLVDEITYNADSASWNQQINALEQFTSSQQPSFTALNEFTASQLTINSGVNAFTQSANGRLTALENETQNLEAFTSSINQIADNGVVQGTSTRLHFSGLVSASIVPNVNGPIASIFIEQDPSKVGTASFNAFTQSVDISIDALNAFTSSINQVSTGSLLVTASFNNSTRNLTFTKGDASTFAVNIPDQSGSTGDFVTTASFNAYTQSNDQKVNSLVAATSSYAISSSVAAVDAAQQVQINSLIAATASYANSASVAAVDAAQQLQINSLISATGSYADSASFAASQLAQDVRINALAAQTSSYVTESETGSFARYDVSNPWSANQTFTNISAVSASFQYVQTVFETASVIYSSGSNQFGDELTDIQTLSGSVRVQGSLTVNGVPVQTSSFDPSALNQATQSLQDFTQSANLRLNALESATSSYANSASVAAVDAAQQLQINALINATASYAISSSVAAVDAAQQAQINSLIAATASLFTSASLGLTTASVSLNTITFTKGDNSTFQLTVDTGSGQAIPAGTISGSAQITALGFVSSSVTASSLVTASISGQLLTFTKGNGTQFNLILPTGSGGGQAVTASYGAFSDTTTQSGSANVAYPFKFDTVDVIDGVTLSGSTGLQVNSTGVYNIQFSAQGVQGAGAGIGNIWFRQNGSDIPNSDTQFTIPSNQKFVAAWNIFATASAGDNFQIIWRSDSANTTWAFITGSGTSPNSPSIIATVNRIDVGGTADLTPLNQFSASINAYTQSNNAVVNALVNATASYVTETESGSFVVTSSFIGDKMTFTKGDASTYELAGIVNTGSSTIAGTMTFSADSNAQARWNLSGSEWVGMQKQVGLNRLIWVDNNNEKLLSLDLDTDTFSVSGAFNAGLQQGYAWVGDSTNRSQPVPTSSFAGSSTNTGSLLVTASASGNTITFTKGDASTFNVSVTGGSGQTFAFPSVETISGSFLLTANTANSGAANLTHISGSSQNLANILFKTTNTAGSTIVSGSFNLFTNPSAPAAGRLNYLENSNIFLNDSGFLPTVTASVLAAGGFYPRMRNNMWLGTGPWTINGNTQASSSVQAGSFNNNLFLGSTGTTLNTLGNTGGIAFSHNTFANAGATINAPSRSLAQIAAGESGSNIINILSNAAYGATVTYHGPVSSSTHAFNNNILAAASVTLNAQSSSRALNVNANIAAGTLTFNDNTQFSPTVGSTNTISANIVAGTLNITNRASSSISVVQNNINTTFIDNQLDAAAVNPAAQRLAAFSNNLTVGSLHSVFYSGSMGAVSGSRSMNSSIIAGLNISASMVGDGSGSNIFATSILGRGLSVFGTNELRVVGQTPETAGSTFTGRWNATDGNRASTAQTIFAVGTGTSGSAGIVRKTGFLIDSGSNTFIEGTLNVSGSTSLTGSIDVSGTLTASLQQGYVWVGNASGKTTTVATSSFGGGSAFPYTGRAEITGSLIVSGTYATSDSYSFQAPYGRIIGNDIIIQQVDSGANSQIKFGTQLEINPGCDLIVNVPCDFKVYSNDITLIGTNPSHVLNNQGNSTIMGLYSAPNKTIQIYDFLLGAPLATFGVSGSVISGSTGHQITGSTGILGDVTVSGSISTTGSVSVGSVLTLGQLNPLPAGTDGQLAVSASNLYFYSGSAWNKVAFA